jgi:hypothetical protein
MMISIRKVACLGSVFFAILLSRYFSCEGAGGYIPVNRMGKTSQALATRLRNRLLSVVNPTDIGPILAAEIHNNDHRCDRDTQLTYLTEHLREHGHWEDAYAIVQHRGMHAPDSKYETNPDLNVHEFDQITQDLVNLLLSRRVSFSIGELQDQDRDICSFVLYANIGGCGINNLLSPPGRHIGRNTNYIRIAFRFMDRIRMDLGPLNLHSLQLIIVTMFPENPASNGLCDSILPNGVDVVTGNPAGAALGALPLPSSVDSRIPAVAPPAVVP